jgi:hypothetical protein
LHIDWQLEKLSGAKVSYGTTKHLVYVNGSASTDIQFETVLHIGTRAARGEAPPSIQGQSPVFQKIWSEFAANVVDGVTNVSGDALTYYIGWPPLGWFQLHELIYEHAGRCQAWAELLQAVCRQQGVPDVGSVWITPQPPAVPVDSDDPHFGLTTPTIDVWAPGARWYLLMDDDVVGQGNPIPPRFFSNHMMTRFDGRLYDPSYGLAFESQLEWERGPFRGLQAGIDAPPAPPIQLEPTWVTALFVREDRDPRTWTLFRI